jgi:molybdopterin converting factor subunit 1
MTIKLQYFGLMAEVVGCQQESLTLAKIATVAELKAALLEKYPQLSSVYFTLAVNQKMASENTPIDATSEIALLPPFAGG